MRTNPHPAHRSENAEVHEEEGDFCAQHSRRRQDCDQVAGLYDIASLKSILTLEILETGLTMVRFGLEVSETLMSHRCIPILPFCAPVLYKARLVSQFICGWHNVPQTQAT